jgi:hypothetical protein
VYCAGLDEAVRMKELIDGVLEENIRPWFKFKGEAWMFRVPYVIS